MGANPAATHAAGEIITVDNSDPGYSDSTTDAGTWSTGTGATGKYGSDYRFAHATGSTSLTTGTATWRPDLPFTGDYDVYAWWSQGSNRSADAPYTVHGSAGSATVRINQQVNGGAWNLLGRYHFSAGTSGTVTLTNNAGPTVVMADAVRFVHASEIRAFWASRFEWPDATTSTAQSNLVNIMATAQSSNFNTVFLQVRGQMDTHYRSPYEPWSNTYNWTDPGWDPLQFAIDEAHSRGLELHAYVNTHTMASPVPPAVTTPQHVYNLHGPGAPPGAENWTIHDGAGNPQTSTNSSFSNYYWLSPGVPEASWRTRREMVYLARNYEIDGLHFDRIRTPGPGYSHDPITLARFNGDGNPDDLAWGDFMRSQITRDLRSIYGELMYWKPSLKISSAPIGINRRDSSTTYQGWGSPAFHNYYQDTWAWMSAHVQDFTIPQIYWEINSNHPFEGLLADWQANRGGRYIVAGSRTNKTIASDGPKPIGNDPGEIGLLTEQQETRNQNAAGHCVFSFGSLGTVPSGETMDYWTGFRTLNYDRPTTVPEMPWKTRPTTGYITGYIQDAQGNPVLDARVNLDGDSYNYLSGFDGFFAILDVPPATTHSLTSFKLGSGSVQQNSITVAAGQVTSLTLVLTGSRGVVDFHKPRYHLNSVATIRVYDADLAGSGSTEVTVVSTGEPAGEMVTLTETATPGRFEGTLQLQETASGSGDARLRVSPGDAVTASWNDADDGSGNSVARTDTAPVIVPRDIILESRQPNGSVTPAPAYQEFLAGGGSWNSTEHVGAPSVVIKSLAPGLSGQGGRYTGTNSVGAYAVFTPTIPSPGYYDVYVTLPGAARGANNHSPGAGYTIAHDGGTITGTFDLSRFTSGMTDQWYLLASGVRFAAGSSGSIRITNNNATSNDSGERFSMDAVKLVFVQPVPVRLGAWEIE